MNLLYSIFFGASVAAIAYAKLGKRIGYGNPSGVWILVGVVFMMATIFFFTLTTFFIDLE